MELYILGNGFDVHHGLATRFRDYKDYLEENAGHLARDYERFAYFLEGEDTPDDRWTSIEETMRLDYEELLFQCMDGLMPNMMDDNPGWDDPGIEVDNQTSFIFDFTGEQFARWLTTIDTSAASRDVHFSSDPVFITFNYTDTLERVYGFDENHILHIHGCINKIDGSDLLSCDGTGIHQAFIPEDLDVPEVITRRDQFNNNAISPKAQFGNPENNPQKVEKELIAQYEHDDLYGATIEHCVRSAVSCAEAAFKDIPGNIDNLNTFLDTYTIDRVCIFGHSFNGIDKPYYTQVFIPRFRNKHWDFVLHGSTAKEYGKKVEECKDFCRQAGIDDYCIIESRKGLEI